MRFSIILLLLLSIKISIVIDKILHANTYKHCSQKKFNPNNNNNNNNLDNVWLCIGQISSFSSISGQVTLSSSLSLSLYFLYIQKCPIWWFYLMCVFVSLWLLLLMLLLFKSFYYILFLFFSLSLTLHHLPSNNTWGSLLQTNKNQSSVFIFLLLFFPFSYSPIGQILIPLYMWIQHTFALSPSIISTSHHYHHHLLRTCLSIVTFYFVNFLPSFA